MAIGNGDIVVHGAQIRSGSDKINVMVGVVIFLELNRRKAIASEGRRRGQFLDEVTYIVGIYFRL